MFQVLFAVGLGLINYVLPKLFMAGAAYGISEMAIQPVLDNIQAEILQRMNGLPADGVHFLQFTGVFEGVSIVFSAYSVALFMKAITLSAAARASKAGVGY